MGRRIARVRVGCSGWQYRHWKGVFYPVALPQRDWLRYYAQRFDTVEINNSFYRLPDAEIFAGWRERSPSAFVFAVKASRFLTHMKKLKAPQEPVQRLFVRAAELRRKLGPVLYQLPKHMGKNVERLSEFLDALPAGKHAVEFRHSSWYDREVLDLLRTRDVALCLHDMPDSRSPRKITARFVYVRFHGPAGRYEGAYPRPVLDEWADWLTSTGRPGYVYFNNDIGGHAPRDAATLASAIVNRAAPGSNRGVSKRPSGDRSPY